MKSLFMLSCVLTLSLVVCQVQNGESDEFGSGGSGDDIEPMIPTARPKITKKMSTRKPDDTEIDSGSGDDDEDKMVVSRPWIRPTSKVVTDIILEPSTDDIEISGSGGSGEEPLTTPSTVRITRISTQDMQSVTRPATTIGNKIININTVEPKTREPKVTTESKDDVEVIHSPTTDSPDEKTTTLSNDVGMGAGDGKTPKDPNEISDDDDDDQGNGIEIVKDPKAKQPKGPEFPKNLAQKSKSSAPKKSSGLNFTTGIIIGVVVGAVLAILIILFLVYRLRKKDEGSYLLEEPGTAYTKQEPTSPTSGKEYFA